MKVYSCPKHLQRRRRLSSGREHTKKMRWNCQIKLPKTMNTPPPPEIIETADAQSTARNYVGYVCPPWLATHAADVRPPRPSPRSKYLPHTGKKQQAKAWLFIKTSPHSEYEIQSNSRHKDSPKVGAKSYQKAWGKRAASRENHPVDETGHGVGHDPAPGHTIGEGQGHAPQTLLPRWRLRTRRVLNRPDGLRFRRAR